MPIVISDQQQANLRELLANQNGNFKVRGILPMMIDKLLRGEAVSPLQRRQPFPSLLLNLISELNLSVNENGSLQEHLSNTGVYSIQSNAPSMSLAELLASLEIKR